jgi:hypothetical protein
MKVIYFSAQFKVENVGQSQKVNDVAVWVSEHSDLLPNATITSNRLTLNAGGAPSVTINSSSGTVATEINSNATLASGFGSTPSVSPASLNRGTGVPSSGFSTFTITSGQTSWSLVAYTANSTPSTANASNHVYDMSNKVTVSGLGNGSCTIQGTQDITINQLNSELVFLQGLQGATFGASMGGIVQFGYVVQTSATSFGSGVMGYTTYSTLNSATNSPVEINLPTYNVSNNVSSVSFTASAGTTYYVVPFLRNINVGGSLFSAFQTRTYRYRFYPPGITSVSANQPVSRTEICAGGLQVVSGTANKVVMERNPSATGAGSVMLAVGGSIEATGNVTANASDERLKDIQGLITNPLSRLKQLNGVIYNWNNLASELAGYDTSIDNVGLIAQDVQKVLPEAVARAPFDSEKNEQGQPVSSKSGENYLTIWYERVVPLLVESVKELSDKVDKLEKENKKLRK